MERESLTCRFDEGPEKSEVKVDRKVQEMSAQLDPLLARIEKLRAKIQLLDQVAENGHHHTQTNSADRGETQLIAPSVEVSTESSATPPRAGASLSAYHVEAGGELDRWIHRQVMGKAENPEACPPYSTDVGQAKRLAARLKLRFGVRVVLGKTGLEERPWFARIHSADGRGVEVLAETLPLAISRLALVEERRRAGRSR